MTTTPPIIHITGLLRRSSPLDIKLVPVLTTPFARFPAADTVFVATFAAVLAMLAPAPERLLIIESGIVNGAVKTPRSWSGRDNREFRFILLTK